MAPGLMRRTGSRTANVGTPLVGSYLIGCAAGCDACCAACAACAAAARGVAQSISADAAAVNVMAAARRVALAGVMGALRIVIPASVASILHLSQHLLRAAERG